MYLTPSNIIVAALVAFAYGALWYSPILFINVWMKGEGMTKETLPKRTPLYLLQTNLYSLISLGAMASVLAIIFDLLAVPTLKAAIALALLLGFGLVVTTRFMDMIYTVHGKHYEARSQIRFLLSSSYYLGTIVVLTVVLFAMAHR